MFTVRDKWFRILIIILPTLVAIYYSRLLSERTLSGAGSLIVSFLSIIAVTEGSRRLVYRSHAWKKPIRKWRIPIVFSVGLIATSVILILSAIIRHFFSSGEWDTHLVMNSNIMINNHNLVTGIYAYGLMKALACFPFVMIAFEILYHNARMGFTEKEREKLEKEKLKAELQQLKGIINPHFLFNNLNSLSSLISEDPAHAEVFLDELTKVFRYLLRNNENELTTLRLELHFIQSYFHLLETRYGKALTMDINISPDAEDWLLPPLTLQLLIENVVKHNRMNKEQPLHIEISTTPTMDLLVRNSINKKESGVESTGIGLQNINSRYRMLNKPGVRIEQNEQFFSVYIPLIVEQGLGFQV